MTLLRAASGVDEPVRHAFDDRDNKEMTDALNQSGGLATIVVRKGDSGQLVRLDAVLTR